MPGGSLQSLDFIVLAVRSLVEDSEKQVGSFPVFPEGDMGSHLEMMLNPPSPDQQRFSSASVSCPPLWRAGPL